MCETPWAKLLLLAGKKVCQRYQDMLFSWHIIRRDVPFNFLKSSLSSAPKSTHFLELMNCHTPANPDCAQLAPFAPPRVREDFPHHHFCLLAVRSSARRFRPDGFLSYWVRIYSASGGMRHSKRNQRQVRSIEKSAVLSGEPCDSSPAKSKAYHYALCLKFTEPCFSLALWGVAPA